MHVRHGDAHIWRVRRKTTRTPKPRAHQNHAVTKQPRGWFSRHDAAEEPRPYETGRATQSTASKGARGKFKYETHGGNDRGGVRALQTRAGDACRGLARAIRAHARGRGGAATRGKSRAAEFAAGHRGSSAAQRRCAARSAGERSAAPFVAANRDAARVAGAAAAQRGVVAASARAIVRATATAGAHVNVSRARARKLRRHETTPRLVQRA